MSATTHELSRHTVSNNETTSARDKNAERRQWTRVIVTISVAAMVLLAGYADLWRGGQTTSALLLSFGYLIMVPMAIVALPPGRMTVEK